MHEAQYKDLVFGKENKTCIVNTRPRSYEVVYIKDNKPKNDLLMIVRAIGPLRRELENVATTEGKKIENGVFGIVVNSIESIEFKD